MDMASPMVNGHEYGLDNGRKAHCKRTLIMVVKPIVRLSYMSE